MKPIPDADGSEGVAVACHAGLRVEPGHPGRPIVSFLAQLAIHARRVALEEEVVSCQSRRRLSTRNITPRLKVFIFIEDFIHFSTISLTLHPMQTPPPSILPSVLMLPLSASTFKYLFNGFRLFSFPSQIATLFSFGCLPAGRRSTRRRGRSTGSARTRCR